MVEFAKDPRKKRTTVASIAKFVAGVAEGDNELRGWVVDAAKKWDLTSSGPKTRQAKRMEETLTRSLTSGGGDGGGETVRIANQYDANETAERLVNVLRLRGELVAPVALMTAAVDKGMVQSADVRSRLSAGDFGGGASSPYLVVLCWKGSLRALTESEAENLRNRAIGHFVLYVFRFDEDVVAVTVYDSFSHKRQVDNTLAKSLLQRYCGRGRSTAEKARGFVSKLLKHFQGQVPLQSLGWADLAGFHLLQVPGDSESCGYQSVLALLLFVARLPDDVRSAVDGKIVVTPTRLLLFMQSLYEESRKFTTMAGPGSGPSAFPPSPSSTTTTTTTTTTA